MLDRLLLARLLARLQDLQLPGGVRARGPRFCEATAFDAALADAVAAAGEGGVKWGRGLRLCVSGGGEERMMREQQAWAGWHCWQVVVTVGSVRATAAAALSGVCAKQ